ncbi:hypothetical protein M1D70_04960 [Paenibacillus sp. AK002]
MKISTRFNLGATQQELDFIDIDTTEDIPLFLDPFFLSIRHDQWSLNASRTIRGFFQYLIELLNVNRIEEARDLFNYLGEPNETCLGISQGLPRGRGVGEEDATEIFESLLESRAVESGLVEDLEDCVIFVDNFGKDKLSDMTTNIIRRHLIEYTHDQCKLWGIPLTDNVPSGYYWSRENVRWEFGLTEMLVVDGKVILLVPKAIVSYSKNYSYEKYHQHFVLNFLQREHLTLNSVLVKRKVLKNGTEKVWVSKKDIKEHEAPCTKEFIRGFTQRHPSVYEDFTNYVKKIHGPLMHEELNAGYDVNTFVEYLINKLEQIPPGRANANEYHKHIVGILAYIFYPNLSSPQLEREIHEGRKRIDIVFDNSADKGFFYRFPTRFELPAQFIYVECKNYSSDPENPELDQLSGRFSWQRGKLGFLLCRSINNMNLFINRCRDTYNDGRGVIIPIVDNDLIFLLNGIKEGSLDSVDVFLDERIRDIVLR